MKNSLVTGGTGFLGRYIVDALRKNGYGVDRLSRTETVEIPIDLSENTPIFNKPYNLVIHCAGKAHSVPSTEDERSEFFKVNVGGTRHLLQGLGQAGSEPDMIVFISTVAVYGLSYGNNIREDHSLDGQDAYARSKIQAEELLREWCIKKNVHLIILRLPLIWGIDAPGNLGAMRQALSKGLYFSIGKGSARKSIVHPADVADLIANVSEATGIYNLTDGCHPTFREIEIEMARRTGKTIRSMPYLFALLLAWLGDVMKIFRFNFPINSDRLKKMTSDLTFDDSLARQTIGWSAGSFIKRDGV